MNKNIAVGIDLGTSTSEICIFRGKEPQMVSDPGSKSPIVPSLVACNKRGELLVGEDARPWVDIPGQGVREVKRKMGTAEKVRLLDKEYRPEEISAVILKKLKDNAEQMLGQTIKEVVLSVPANFPDAARQATLDAGDLAGLKILRLINEPTAAALAFGIKNIGSEEQIVVFDFGGGTLDITVLEMMEGILDVKASFGDTQLGGKDFDEALIDLIISNFSKQYPGVSIPDRARAALKGEAEKCKVALTTKPRYESTVPSFGFMRGDPLDLEIDLSRGQFEEAVGPLLDRARECIRQALKAKKIRPSAIDRVLLVGGTTYIPCVRRLVQEMFGKNPSIDVNPDLAVAMGASVQAAIATDIISPEQGVILTDVSPFGLGIPIVTSFGGRDILVYESLINPNTTIPYSVKKVYSLLHANQDTVDIRLYQDHTGNAKLMEDVKDTGVNASIKKIPPAPDGKPHPLEIEFSYDVNGIARLEAVIPATKQRVNLVYSNTGNRMSEEDKIKAKEKVDDLWTKSPLAKRYEGMIEKAKNLVPTLGGDKKTALQTALRDLLNALASGDNAKSEKAGDFLADFLFDLETEGR
ncbi:MAG: molecular chaperone DnaK [Planctomycetes bacterium]|nr:molecular chaperone DnaK [Planctomycetota bacterium]